MLGALLTRRVALATIGWLVLNAGTASAACPTSAASIETWHADLTGGTVISAATSDTSFNPFTSQSMSLTYVSQGPDLYAYYNKDQDTHSAGQRRWALTITGTTLQNTPSPVPLADPNDVTKKRVALIFATADGWVHRYDETGTGVTGSSVWDYNTKRPTCSTDTVTATPTVQLRQYSTGFTAGDDLVYVVTRTGCGDVTSNRVIALRGSNGGEVWTFNKNFDYDVDFGAEGCFLDYDLNRLYCGTNLPDGRYQNTLWAIDTNTGNLKWSANAGTIQTRPQRVSSTQRLYVGTLDGVIKAFDASSSSTGNLLWENPVTTGNIARTPWAEFRAGGYAGVLWVIDSSGDLHEVYDDSGTEGVVVWSFTGNSLDSLAFDPSNSKLYAASMTNKRLYQIDPSTGSSNESMRISSAVSTATAVNDPALDVIGSSSTINRVLIGNQGKLRSLCIPWVGSLTETSVGFDDDPAGPNMHPAGTACTSDADCRTGHPTLDTACTKGACDTTTGSCFAAPIMSDGTPSEGKSCMGGDPWACTINEVCHSGACIAKDHAACGCGMVGGTGGPACGVGEECCGTTCTKLGADPANCGACGIKCLTGQLCSNGQCMRNDKFCTEYGTDMLLFPGATSVTYSNKGGKCGARAMNTHAPNFPQGFRIWNDPISFDINNSASQQEVAPIAGTFDGRFVFGFLTNAPAGSPIPYPLMPQLHQYDANHATNVVFSSTALTAPVYGVGPYSALYLDDGPVGPVVNHKHYLASLAMPDPDLRLYVANDPSNGQVSHLDGRFGGAAGYSYTSSLMNFSSEGVQRIDALAYANLRWELGQRVGVLLAAYRDTLAVFCSPETNAAPSCPLARDGTSMTGAFGKQIHLNTLTYLGYTIGRVFNIAVDRDLYGDAYLEVVDTAGRQHMVRFHAMDFSIHAMNEVQNDLHMPIDVKDPLSGQGRMAISANHGVRIKPATEAGMPPSPPIEIFGASR